MEKKEIIPICHHCGRPLRVSIPRHNGIIYDVKQQEQVVPWNYGWKGKCENCGYDYNIHTVVPIEQGKKKVTTVRADVCRILTTPAPDEFTVLSGVTIETYVPDFYNGGGEYSKVFLSAKELKYIVNALSDSPLMEQSDYFHDNT